MQPLVIYGAGGHAREMADLVSDVNAERPQWNLLGFLADEASSASHELNGLPVLGGREWLEQRPADVQVVVGVGSPQWRRSIAEALRPCGVRFPVLRHPTAVVSRHVEIGDGTQIAAGCIVTVNVTIGAFVVLNRACNVSHDCGLGDFVTIAPGVQLAGNVTIETGCDVGIGASVIQGVSIGEWAVIGAGAAVTDTLPANCTAVGVPAKVIKQRQPGWYLSQ
jgi:sugar O-acyltransferase (sialic acid O-acetyltransferase NeuD family)